MENKVSLSVSIVIPNWNGIELLKKHLPTVIKNSDGARIIIVDDHSTDDSVSYLERIFSDILVVRKDRHEGFASTVNAGVQEANTDIVVLLNTDIEPEKGFLQPLLSHFSDPDVFAVGCMDKSMENGKVVLRGRGIGWWEKGFYIHKRGEVDKTDTAWVSGGSGAFRRSMWNELGGMDTFFNPFYWEDIDLSYRARKAGWKTLFEPKSIVVHFHEQGKIKKDFSDKEIKRIAFRNQFYFIWKQASVYQFIQSFIWTPIQLLKDMVRRDKSMMWGFFQAIRFFPVICMHRLFKHL
jgi:GT2 family glycosyltransferase